MPKALILVLLRLTGRKPKLHEGLNQIFALKARTVKELLHPVEDFPANLRPYFFEHLSRYTFQMSNQLLTTLYTIRKVLLNR